LPAIEATKQPRRAENRKRAFSIKALSPFRQQPGRQEEHRHHCQQQEFAQGVAAGHVEMVAIEHGSGEKRADHEMKARPVGGKPAGRKPDQADRPAIVFSDAGDQFAHAPGGKGERAAGTAPVVPCVPNRRE
jgi:hypothetical protein